MWIWPAIREGHPDAECRQQVRQYAAIYRLGIHVFQVQGQRVGGHGFPANNFGGQEPGTELEIKAFCEETYKVDFPMFAKVSVKGTTLPRCSNT